MKPAALLTIITVALFSEFAALQIKAQTFTTLYTAQPMNSNGFNVVLYSLPGLNYEIQASSNLVDWTTITNFVSTNSPFYLSLPTAINTKQGFYRAVLP